MISVDIETLGLGIEAPIIQIGAVAFDPQGEPGTIEGCIEFLVEHERYDNVEPYAAAMNWKLLAALGDYENYQHGHIFISVDAAAEVFKEWLETFAENVTFTGKNFASFDLPRLQRLPGWNINHHHRILDPGSMWYRPEDGCVLPSTKTCMERAGITGEVAHTAMEDAAQVAKLIQIWSRQ